MHELVEPIGEVRPLRDPVLIAAFSGWNDFGGAAAAAIDHIARQWKASDLAEIRNERLFDFTVERPKVRLEGEQRVIDWPRHRFRLASPPGAERDFVLLSGPEPHLRWRTFTEAIADFMVEVGATLSITIAAQAGAVPHTRPLPVTLSASDSDFEGQFGLRVPQSRYEGPTGIVGAFNVDQRQRGFRNASLWAQLPHYLSAGPNPNAISALVRLIDRGFGTDTSLATDRAAHRALQGAGTAGDHGVGRSRVLHPHAGVAVRRQPPPAHGAGHRRRSRAPLRRGPAQRPRGLPPRSAGRGVGAGPSYRQKLPPDLFEVYRRNVPFQDLDPNTRDVRALDGDGLRVRDILVVPQG